MIKTKKDYYRKIIIDLTCLLFPFVVVYYLYRSAGMIEMPGGVGFLLLLCWCLFWVRDLLKILILGIEKELETPADNLKSANHTFRYEVWETTNFLIIALAIVIPIRFFIAQPFIISGASMDPTFKDKQYLIVDELSYHLGDPLRGDVVIFKYPKNPKQYFIKRVIGLPGETVLIDNDGKVFIKDQTGKITLTLKEPYVVHTKDGSTERTLKSGEYFMMGDNRSGSFDSRAWGPVNRDLIVGRAFLRLFPVNTIGVLPGQYRQ